MPNSRRLPRGFTLIELLVVVAILGTLVALLLPALQMAREAMRRSSCGSNLHQFGIALRRYEEAHHCFPCSWPNGNEEIAWARSLLPFIEEGSLYRQFDASRPFTDGVNSKLIATSIPLYKCPSAPSDPTYLFTLNGTERTYGTCDYRGCEGVNGSDPLYAGWNQPGWRPGITGRFSVAARQVTDGLSKTLALVESVGGDVLYGPLHTKTGKIWYHSDGSWIGRSLSGVNPTLYSLAMKVSPCTVNCSNQYCYGPYSFHPGLAQGVMADGAVHTIHDDIDPRILGAWYSYNDDQTLSLEP
ncbi:MAG TPA: DUF1559 domain-containing protein [Pirellulales bacterium]|nr:DUF1559 domain-containing protein [Pirellulales bacterium]